MISAGSFVHSLWTMKKAKPILTLAAVSACLIGSIFSLLFTTAEIPASLINTNGSASPREKYTALVFNLSPRRKLEGGDLILVKIENGTTSTREVRKLERIQFPNDSQRMKASGRRRAIGQAILDMDHTPQYWVSESLDTNSPVVSIPESDVKGKVVHTFTR